VQWRLPSVTGGLAPGVKRHVLAWIDAHLHHILMRSHIQRLAEHTGKMKFTQSRLLRQIGQAHLIQHYSTVQWRLPSVTGGLAPGVKRHVLAWIALRVSWFAGCRQSLASKN
jgi:hypothetical protein